MTYTRLVTASVAIGAFVLGAAVLLAVSDTTWRAALMMAVGLAIPLAAVRGLTVAAAVDNGDAASDQAVEPAAELVGPALLPPSRRAAVQPPEPIAESLEDLQPAIEPLPPPPSPQSEQQPSPQPRVNPRGQGVPLTIADVQAGIAAGMSPAQIARRHGCHVTTVHRRQREALRQRVRHPLKAVSR